MKKELTGKVYLITSPAGRKYVGSTKRKIEIRFKEYKNLLCTSQIRLYNSLVKHGVDNHLFEVILEGEINLMYKMERILGEHHNVIDRHLGLNCHLPGYDDVPVLISEESRKKISDSKKGEKHWAFGKKIPDSTKIKMSKAHKGKLKSEETKKNISNGKKKNYTKEKHYNFGKKLTSETKKKMSISHTGKIRTKEHAENIGKANKGRKSKESTKLKISIATRGENHPMFGLHHKPESKQKMSEAHKGKRTGKDSPLYGKFGKDSPKSKPVIQLTMKDEFVKRWDSAADVHRELKFAAQGVSSCCSGKLKHAYGFKWKYAEKISKEIE